ncbi:MAG: ribosomal protein S18-alanine N-acetyltransferase [Gammaproteobacteria bacterium]|nr:ribosomal protein S18-alanine N-acetyltransferase [Gammaproteobacteria bacterium]
MHHLDLDEVLDNDIAAYDYPWTRGIFSDCMQVGYYCRVLELGDTVIGHLIISVQADEAHLLNVCVHPDWQGRGYGLSLLLHGMRAAFGAGAQRMYLEVRAGNLAAIRLYQSQGFSVVGRRSNYYQCFNPITAEEQREDALVMARSALLEQDEP